MQGGGMSSSALLQRIIHGTRGNWRAFIAGDMPPVAAARSCVFCRSCQADTAHDRFDDSGLGWYAQIWRCRRCGQQDFKIWPIGFW
jgi:hypothetical protein